MNQRTGMCGDARMRSFKWADEPDVNLWIPAFLYEVYLSKSNSSSKLINVDAAAFEYEQTKFVCAVSNRARISDGYTASKK